jgi:hypothetical protein
MTGVSSMVWADLDGAMRGEKAIGRQFEVRPWFYVATFFYFCQYRN